MGTLGTPARLSAQFVSFFAKYYPTEIGTPPLGNPGSNTDFSPKSTGSTSIKKIPREKYLQ